jgi:hypothetical protein
MSCTRAAVAGGVVKLRNAVQSPSQNGTQYRRGNSTGKIAGRLLRDRSSVDASFRSAPLAVLVSSLQAFRARGGLRVYKGAFRAGKSEVPIKEAVCV